MWSAPFCSQYIAIQSAHKYIDVLHACVPTSVCAHEFSFLIFLHFTNPMKPRPSLKYNCKNCICKLLFPHKIRLPVGYINDKCTHVCRYIQTYVHIHKDFPISYLIVCTVALDFLSTDNWLNFIDYESLEQIHIYNFGTYTQFMYIPICNLT